MEASSEMVSADHLSANFEIPSETSRGRCSSTHLELSPKTIVRKRSSFNTEPSSEIVSADHLSANFEIPSETSRGRCSSTHIEPPPDTIVRKRPSFNTEPSSEIFSADYLSANHELSSETYGSARASIDSEGLKPVLNLHCSSSRSETMSETIPPVSSSNKLEVSTDIVLRRRLSIDHEAPSAALHSQQPSICSERESAIALDQLSSMHSEVVKSLEMLDDKDADLLHQMGYTQELKRGFSGLMSFTFCFTVVSIFPSISTALDFGLNTGGSGVIFWSWIVGSIFNILVGLALSEICSTYPNSGSVYYWTSQLAPINYAPLTCYICGWCTLFGNIGGCAAFASGFGSILNAAVALGSQTSNGTYGLNDVPHPLSLSNQIQAGIAIGVVVLWAIQNCLNISQQGWLNNLAAFIQTASTVSIIITILVLAKPRALAYEVFIETYNGTGFSFPYVCLIGILPTLFSFSGFEAAGHLTEETQKADRKAPIAITGTCISAAFIGLAYILALLFASGNPQLVAEYSLNPSATVQIFQTSTPYRVALLFTVLLIICLYFAGVSSMTVSSRTLYTLGRDSLFPCKKYLCMVHKRTQTPLVCVLVVALINILLLLLQLVSTTAFAAIVSISTIGFQISYMLPIIFRITSSRKTFKKGKFNLGGFGFIIHLLSAIWLFVTCVILLFPFDYPITAQNMNWSIVVCSGIAILAGIYWIFSLRTWFTGPPRMIDSDVEAPPLDDVTTTQV